jgi:Caspase domain
MTLVRDAQDPILWTNPDWTPGTAGTFAVVIGVSRYDHLAGGRAPAANTYGLGQLCVSSLTAFRFFRWLRDDYCFPAAPLARVWLLLAPCSAEEEFAPTEPEDADFQGVRMGVPEPSFVGCERAVLAWYAEMQALAADAARASRAFFYFTGHGLEITEEKQILLPSDYLEPPVARPNRAISVLNLRRGLAPLAVRDQFFFLDACRNDHRDLRAQDIEGTPILPTVGSSNTNPARNAVTLYGSASGTQAWSPLDVREGPSIFGRALLEGLSGRRGVQVDCPDNGSGELCDIHTYPLHAFVRGRVSSLLRERGATVEQYVPLGGPILDNPSVTRVPRVDPGTRVETAPDVPPTVFTQALNAPWGWNPHEDASGLDFFRGTDRFSVHEPVTVPDGHEVFGSELVTELWQGARVYSLSKGEWLGASAGYHIHHVEHDLELRVYRVTLSVPEAVGNAWFELGTVDTRFICLLPSEPEGPPRFLLNLFHDAKRRLVRLEAGLSLGQREYLLAHAVKLWERYRRENVLEVASGEDMKHLQELLRLKKRAPLAATIAGTILLRAGRLDLLHDWLENLASWFPSLPDGRVLRFEQRLRESGGKGASPKDVRALLEVRGRGLPFTTEAFGYFARQVEDLQDSEGVPMPMRADLYVVRQWTRTIERYVQSGSLFTVLAGSPEALSPELATDAFPA